ncbi:hypothetical protein TNIN_298781 [Trichonephila inaurata madagascariensis]|uniref:Uncharacterized protein n=1 Tax=Trichonephila inaurata madagascariensis TaxID=2747483 RepID=A0A8X7CGQ7_9ARAC|nr:hypothetical protein TNIN_298781 [Trichonephila inaurata madagascariensis]
MCSSIDARASNSKLWRPTEFFSNDQPQMKDSNIVLDPVGQVPQDNKEAANILGKFYKSILTFNENDKKVKKIAKRMVHNCRTSSLEYPIFYDINPLCTR